MQTFFKNNDQDWHKKVTVPNTDSNQDSKTTKSQDVLADSNTKQLLDSKTISLLQWNKITLIDITAHVDGTKIFGIVNYISDGQHNQLRF